MVNDARVQRVRELMQEILPDLDLPGLQLDELSFDFIRQSFLITFIRGDARMTLVLPSERVAEIETGSSFAVRRLRKDLETAFGS